MKKRIVTFTEYQEDTLPHANYPGTESILYPILALCGEAGEVADKLKKLIRNRTFDRTKEFGGLDPQQRVAIMMELGDVLWYLQAAAEDLGYTLEEVANHNAIKLDERKLRGTIIGEGDNR